MEADDRRDCEMVIRRVGELLQTGVLEKLPPHVLQQSAFIELMICLRDLLYKSEKYGRRISFADDIVENADVKDVTHAVIAVRDACCHINSFRKQFDIARVDNVVLYGKQNAIAVGDVRIGSKYEDDVAYVYGRNLLYLKRHIRRAFQEAQAYLAPLLKVG